MCQLRWPTQQQSHSKRCSIYSPLPLRDWFWWTCKFSDWYFNWYSKLGKHSDKGTLINIVALLFMTRVAEQTVSTSAQYTSSICWAQSKGPILIFNWVSQRSKNVKKECSCCRRWLSHSQPAAHLGTFLGLIICLHYKKKFHYNELFWKRFEINPRPKSFANANCNQQCKYRLETFFNDVHRREQMTRSLPLGMLCPLEKCKKIVISYHLTF